MFKKKKIKLKYISIKKKIIKNITWFCNKKIFLLTQIIIRIFSKIYKININEAEKNKFSDYKTFNDFFTRKLKKNSRPILTNKNQIAFPSDGTVNQIGKIMKNKIFQAKNCFYNLDELLGENYSLSNHFYNGKFITIYLSPGNYHRVHMPCDGIVSEMIYIPGDVFLLTLKNSKKVPKIFSKSERLVCVFETKFGKILQILVGAKIVGSIETIWHGCVNKKNKNTIKKWTYSKKNRIFIKKGKEMGKFCLGSTVINIFQKNSIKFKSNLKRGSTVKIGELLAEKNKIR